MDYLTKVIEDSVFDSPPSYNHILQVVNMPLPLRIKPKAAA